MTGRNLEGRVAIVTGAGRGLGREHALLLAEQGALVVVNDYGGATDGTGADRTTAQAVVDEIEAAGGVAVANGDNVAEWEGARRLVDTALDRFGDLHVLVNNAGILRDRLLFNMTEAEWDAVVDVHMKGHFCPTRFAAEHWRQRAKSGQAVQASVVNTSSGAGLLANPGQANYGAAKAGIAAFTMIAAKELARFGVRCNAVAPVARTRLTLQTPGFDEMVQPPDDPDRFDVWAPGNVSPLVAYLATEDCPYTGGIFHVFGGQVAVFHGWELGEVLDAGRRWTVEELRQALPAVAGDGSSLLSQGTALEDLLQRLDEAAGAA